jgi:hypothetical protein
MYSMEQQQFASKATSDVKMCKSLDLMLIAGIPFMEQSLCLHFFFKYRPSSKDGNNGPIQAIESDFDVSLQCEDSQDR